MGKCFVSLTFPLLPLLSSFGALGIGVLAGSSVRRCLGASRALASTRRCQALLVRCLVVLFRAFCHLVPCGLVSSLTMTNGVGNQATTSVTSWSVGLKPSSTFD